MEVKNAKKVRLGVVGVGGMGGNHANWALNGEIPRCELTAVCDVSKENLKRFPQVKSFTDCGEMVRSGEINALLIATPHYFHADAAIHALQHGIHVLVEKPISVHKADGEKMLAAHQDQKLVFAIMFNTRTIPHYRKIRELIQNGELGEIRRVQWSLSSWFRTNAYYASGGWRATWAGEGGGVLLNQCPHHLDIYQWLFGMPKRVRGFCKFGRYHPIEVEDDVTAYFEYANGAHATFIASTGESPGINRLEIIAEKGRLTLEDEKILTFLRNEIPMSEFCRTSNKSFEGPPFWKVEIPVNGQAGLHREITANFVDAILDGVPLIAPAAEGIHSLELANAMVYSSCMERAIELPLDSAVYEAFLKDKIAGSTFKKKWN